MIKTDVCIIGSGPSGASTSLMLSKMKIPHYIIDKSTFPRDKTCGDGLILYAYKALLEIDKKLFDNFLKNPKFIHSKKIRLHINNDLNIDFQESKERDMVISYAKRYDFDHFLIKHLSEEYTTCEFGNGVKSLKQHEDGILIKLKDNKEIIAKIVVGADGANSIVSRKLAKNKIFKKLSSTFVSGYFKGVIDMPKNNNAEVRIIYKKMPLYFYIFPLADGSSNVTLGGRSDLILKHKINLIKEIESIIAKHSKTCHRFNNAEKIGSWRGWSIPYDFDAKKVYGNRFLLVGDAAGLTNAFYKEGVGTGMMSGIICAKKITQTLNTDNFSENFLSSYQTDLKKEFGKLLNFSNFMAKLANYRYLFSSIVYLLKNRVERKSFDIIKRRSY
ncbi:NAD(P)/FAD-dependent oxidoreductase [uncultured Polaribacter sp.]|uniref:NAD(P)/FAD-dependent oxidoreductase n=1 Tax=uncultured Polaribacter sp. TaxID=174711 RepID=UPI002610C184|nr:NAD(P)/FAD-dependent oxidoreductase [uncultured Polaribacter sp.]